MDIYIMDEELIKYSLLLGKYSPAEAYSAIREDADRFMRLRSAMKTDSC
jgi:hypothetical protein